MGFESAFYSTDHRLIALAMIVVLAVACDIGFRMGSRKRDASDSGSRGRWSLAASRAAVLLASLTALPVEATEEASTPPNESIVTDRATDSASPELVPRKTLQFELGYKFSRLDTHSLTDRLGLTYNFGPSFVTRK